ncbi:hypothetical protein GCM10009605_12870 [Nocardiopsis composta]
MRAATRRGRLALFRPPAVKPACVGLRAVVFSRSLPGGVEGPRPERVGGGGGPEPDAIEDGTPTATAPPGTGRRRRPRRAWPATARLGMGRMRAGFGAGRPAVEPCGRPFAYPTASERRPGPGLRALTFRPSVC